jgi:dihydrofolate reductase
MKDTSIIAAVDKNWLIGKRDSLTGLPWYLPADLRHFQKTTTDQTVVMGRKTYDSIGKPLPNRTNIIISRSDILIPECITVKSTEEALRASPENQEIFIMGGAQIFEQFLPQVQKIYLTKIHHSFEGDIYFPKINFLEWEEIDRKDFGSDEKNKYNYSFIIYKKAR